MSALASSINERTLGTSEDAIAKTTAPLNLLSVIVLLNPTGEDEFFKEVLTKITDLKLEEDIDTEGMEEIEAWPNRKHSAMNSERLKAVETVKKMINDSEGTEITVFQRLECLHMDLRIESSRSAIQNTMHKLLH